MFSPTSILRSVAINPLLKARQVRVTTKPAPKSLAESRLILAELQKFGEVLTFRNLKYAYNNELRPDSLSDLNRASPHDDRVCLAIFETAEAARKAIEASPLKIPVVASGPVFPEDAETERPGLEAQPEHPHADDVHAPPAAAPASSSPPPAPVKPISLNVNPEIVTPPPSSSPSLSSSLNSSTDPATSAPSTTTTTTTTHPLPKPPSHHHRHPLTLTCSITPSNHDHQASIMNPRENPYYGPFGTIRNNYELQDMAYYDAGGPGGAGSDSRAAPASQVAGFTQGSRMDLKEHVRARLREESKRLGAGSLMELFKEGMEEEEEKEKKTRRRTRQVDDEENIKNERSREKV